MNPSLANEAANEAARHKTTRREPRTMNLRTSRAGCFVPHAASQQRPNAPTAPGAPTADAVPATVLPATLATSTPAPPPSPTPPPAPTPPGTTLANEDLNARSALAGQAPMTSWGLDGGYVPPCVRPGLYRAEASRWGDSPDAYVPPPEDEGESLAEPFRLFA